MELSRKIAAEITKYAAEYQAGVIVFEYLEMQGKISGKKKQKLHLWRKRDIQKLCEPALTARQHCLSHSSFRSKYLLISVSLPLSLPGTRLFSAHPA